MPKLNHSWHITLSARNSKKKANGYLVHDKCYFFLCCYQTEISTQLWGSVLFLPLILFLLNWGHTQVALATVLNHS